MADNVEVHNGVAPAAIVPIGRKADEPLHASPVPVQEPVITNPYIGIAAEPFTPEQAAILMQRLEEDDIEMRPDGLVYLPEIRYRRTLNKTFGPGAWALMPRSIDIGDNMLFYRGALFVHGRFVSEAIGEQQYFPNNDRQSYATAAESAKSNCLVRCCKDLGIASELWDPVYTRGWLARNAVEVWCVNRQDPHKRKKFWRKVNALPVDMWPWQEMEEGSAGHRVGKPSTGERAGEKPNAPTKAHKPAEKPATAPSTGKSLRNAPGASEARPVLISPRQAGRYRKIAEANGWTDIELQKLLRSQGFSSVEEITRDSYEELCGYLANPKVLARLRAKDAEQRNGDGRKPNAEEVLDAIME